MIIAGFIAPAAPVGGRGLGNNARPGQNEKAESRLQEKKSEWNITPVVARATVRIDTLHCSALPERRHHIKVGGGGVVGWRGFAGMPYHREVPRNGLVGGGERGLCGTSEQGRQRCRVAWQVLLSGESAFRRGRCVVNAVLI